MSEASRLSDDVLERVERAALPNSDMAELAAEVRSLRVELAEARQENERLSEINMEKVADTVSKFIDDSYERGRTDERADVVAYAADARSNLYPAAHNDAALHMQGELLWQVARAVDKGEHVGAAAPACDHLWKWIRGEKRCVNCNAVAVWADEVVAAPTEAATDCRYCGRLMKHHPGGVYCPQPVAAPVEQKPTWNGGPHGDDCDWLLRGGTCDCGWPWNDPVEQKPRRMQANPSFPKSRHGVEHAENPACNNDCTPDCIPVEAEET